MIKTMQEFINTIKFFDHHTHYCLEHTKVNESTLAPGDWSVQDKEDGVYCNVVVIAEHANSNSVRCFSRDGKQLSNLQWVERVFSNAPPGVYMGEAKILRGNFEDASRFFNPNVVNQLDLQTGQTSFISLFDYVRMDEFITGRSTRDYAQRHKILLYTYNEFLQGTCVGVQYNFVFPTYADAMLFVDNRMSTNPQVEGQVIRQQSAGWKRGERNETIIKYVRYHFYDLRVVGIQIGKGKHANVVGALLVAWKPFADSKRAYMKVPVDGKISYDQRRAWYVAHSMTGNLEGKIAKVRSKGLTSKGMLRQAKLIEIRWDKTTADL